MKAGDLVTLSSYALCSAALWKYRESSWHKKETPAIGVIIRVEANPWAKSMEVKGLKMSKNEKVFYYINWVNKGPASRFGDASYHAKAQGYFLRNDLKHFKGVDK